MVRRGVGRMALGALALEEAGDDVDTTVVVLGTAVECYRAHRRRHRQIVTCGVAWLRFIRHLPPTLGDQEDQEDQEDCDTKECSRRLLRCKLAVTLEGARRFISFLLAQRRALSAEIVCSCESLWVMTNIVEGVERYTTLTTSDIQAQWARIVARYPLPQGLRQETYLPVETLLCYGLFFVFDPHRYGGDTVDKASPVVRMLAALFRRSPASILFKMFNLDGSRPVSRPLYRRRLRCA